MYNKILTAGAVFGALMLPVAAYAQSGVAAGATTGAVGGAIVGGPVGAVVGGVGGAVVGGIADANQQSRFNTYVVEQKTPSYTYSSEVAVGAELPEAGVTYAQKIDKAETRIDWTRPWQNVHDHVRGLSPFPGAWCEIPAVGRLKLLRTTRGEGSAAPGAVLDDRLTVGCREGAVRVLELQKAGGKPMQAEDFLRGTAVARGTQLR